jgi:E3 ubiquitin-protein ligase TRIP12
LACAAALAVQKVIADEDLLSRCQKNGELLSSLLRTRLASPSPAAPYIFDIRGGGLLWGIEFSGHENKYQPSHAGERLAIKIQAKCLENGLIIMGFSGGADLEGVSGEHLVLAPALTCSSNEIETIADILVTSIESVVAEFKA